MWLGLYFVSAKCSLAAYKVVLVVPNASLSVIEVMRIDRAYYGVSYPLINYL